jgi:hypothetical protein
MRQILSTFLKSPMPFARSGAFFRDKYGTVRTVAPASASSSDTHDFSRRPGDGMTSDVASMHGLNGFANVRRSHGERRRKHRRARTDKPGIIPNDQESWFLYRTSRPNDSTFFD